MSGPDLSALIDLVAEHVKPHLGGNEDAADAVATELAGAITSRYMVISLPTETEEAQTRAALAALDVPGLFVGGGRS